MNNLTIIIPLYGKEYSVIKENLLKTILIASRNNVEIIITYKTDDVGGKFDYNQIESDFIEFSNLKFIKNSTKSLRTSKIIEAIKISNTKYTQIMDCHHQINEKSFTKFCEYIENIEYDYLISKYKKIDLDLGIIKEYNWGDEGFSFGAGSSTYKTSILKRSVESIDYDIIYTDDWTYSLHMIYEILKYNENFVPHFTNISWYERIQGSNISTTSKRVDIEISNHLLHNLKFAYSFLNKLEFNEFNCKIIVALSAIENGYFILNGGDKEVLINDENRMKLVQIFGEILKLDGIKKF